MLQSEFDWQKFEDKMATKAIFSEKRFSKEKFYNKLDKISESQRLEFCARWIELNKKKHKYL